MKSRFLESTQTLHVMFEEKTDIDGRDLLLDFRKEMVKTKLVIIDLKELSELTPKGVKALIFFSKTLQKLNIELEIVNGSEQMKYLFDMMNAQYFFSYGRMLNVGLRQNLKGKS